MEMATLSGASMNEAAVDNGAVYVEGLGTQLTPHKVVPPGPPVTPTANLKVLVAAAAAKCAIDREAQMSTHTNKDVKRVLCGEGVECEAGGGCEDDAGGRKNKSLAVLCKKFLSIVEGEVGVGSEFSLESMAVSLGTNRRRIYDIINVLESLEMIVKQSKNWYMWLGRDCLLVTLAKLKAMARDDTEFRAAYDLEGSEVKTESIPLPSSEGVEGEEGAVSRWDKSLGVLCQKFVMLFLVSPNNEVTLDYAGSVLMPDGGEQPTQTSNKTKVRRLYDIANVLTTLNLIGKKTFLAPNHRKMPGYYWCGPSQEQINALSVSRKSDYPLPLYPNKSTLSGVKLSRRASFGKNRPFLHQYEVKGQSERPNSAPNSPVKVKGGGFKRSLSFGGGSNPRGLESEGVRGVTLSSERVESLGGSKVNTRPPDYFSEIRQFEAELLKQAHRYPNVAPLFKEFVQRTLSTLEVMLTSGRTILPKPATPTSQSSLPPISVEPAQRLDKTPKSISPLAITRTSSDVPPLSQIETKTAANMQILPLPLTQGSSGMSQSDLLVSQTQPTGVRSPLQDVSLQTATNMLNRVDPLSGISCFQSSQSQVKPKHIKLECSETVPTVGFSKRISPMNLSLKSTMVKPKLKPTLKGTVSQPMPTIPAVQLTSALLGSLVSQKPIPAVLEDPPQRIQQQLAPVSPSTILAGQIVNCFQPGSVNTTQMVSQLPPLSPQIAPLLMTHGSNQSTSVPSPPNAQPPLSLVLSQNISAVSNQAPISQVSHVVNQTTSPHAVQQLGGKENIPHFHGVSTNRVPLAMIQSNQTPIHGQESIVVAGRKQGRRQIVQVDKENEGSVTKKFKLGHGERRYHLVAWDKDGNKHIHPVL